MLQWYPSVSGSSDLLPNGVSSTLFNLTGVILDVSIRESSTSVLSSPSFSSTSSPTKSIVQPQSLLSSVTSSTKSNVILHPRVLYLKLLDPIDKVNIIDAYLDCPDFLASYPMGLIPGSLIQINSVSIKFVGGVARYCIGNVSSSIRILAASIPRSSHCDNDTTAARPLQDDIVQYHLLPLTYLSQLLDPLQSNHTVSKFCVFVTHIQHISIKAICSSCCSPIQNDTVGCGVTWCRYYRSRSALSPSISNPTPSIQNNQDRIKFEAECKLSISDGSFGGVVVFIKGEENVSCLLNVSLSSKEWKMVRIEATRNGGLMFTGKEGISDSKSDQPNTSAPTKPNRSITFDRLCSSALSFLKWNQLFIYGTHSNFPSPSMPSSSASSSSLPKGISSRTIKMDGGMKEITTLARDKPVMLQVVKVEKPNVVKEGWKMLLELGG
ncbi:hypothetical protein BKA69DRAFT_1083446 [Paraphysoderma sedebokerense]|nr:hypothetical protein BKA69DRAFT_1083446 [Paraphysoderma sedebokerense]